MEDERRADEFGLIKMRRLDSPKIRPPAIRHLVQPVTSDPSLTVDSEVSVSPSLLGRELGCCLYADQAKIVCSDLSQDHSDNPSNMHHIV